jgi:hypothetical protein
MRGLSVINYRLIVAELGEVYPPRPAVAQLALIRSKGDLVTLAGCGIAAIIAGIKQLRDQHRRTVLDTVIWWVYLGIGVLSVVGVVIFLYCR